MGALFGFVFFWIVLGIVAGIGTLLCWIAEKLGNSGTIVMILLGIADFIDWCAKHVRNFFTVMFRNTKEFIYWCYTERRKWHEQ